MLPPKLELGAEKEITCPEQTVGLLG